MENIIEKSFPNSNPTSYLDGELVCGSYTFESKINGRCIEYKSNDFSMAVFSDFNNKMPVLENFTCEYDLVIAKDECLDISTLLKSRTFYCYSCCANHQNSINYGNLAYKI